MTEDHFAALFTEDRPVVFDFHGYPTAVHAVLHHRPAPARFHVKGYQEEGTTTTPFDLLAVTASAGTTSRSRRCDPSAVGHPAPRRSWPGTRRGWPSTAYGSWSTASTHPRSPTGNGTRGLTGRGWKTSFPSIRNRVRTLRTDRGLSQGEFAQALGVTRQTINAIEAGRHAPSLPLALKLCRYLGVPVESVFFDDEPH